MILLRRLAARFPAVGAMCLLVGCGGPNAGGGKNARMSDMPPLGDHAEAEKAARAIIAADNSRDLHAVLECYTEDVVWIPPNSIPLTGLRAIRPRYEEMFTRYTPAIDITIDDLFFSGPRAVARGVTRGRLKANQDGSTIPIDDNFLMLLRKCTDGRWRIELLMWNARGKRTDSPS